MAVSKRTGAAALAVVATALTVTGVVARRHRPQPVGRREGSARPQRLSAQVRRHRGWSCRRAAATACSRTSTSTSALTPSKRRSRFPSSSRASRPTFAWCDHRLYASTANLSSVIGAKWLSTRLTLPSLFGYSLEFVRPDISLDLRLQSQDRHEERQLHDVRLPRDDVAVHVLLGSAKGRLPGVGRSSGASRPGVRAR